MTPASPSGHRDSPPGRPLPGLPGLIGIRVSTLATGQVTATMTVTDAHLVPGTASGFTTTWASASSVRTSSCPASGTGSGAVSARVVRLRPGEVTSACADLACCHE